jgi:TorA maturation chaperone TorD
VERAELPFYREIAQLTAAFLEAERDEIARRLEVAAPRRRD